MLTNFSESTVVKEKTNSQQLLNTESTDSQHIFDPNQAVDDSKPAPVDISGDRQQLLAMGGGVSVKPDEFTEVNTTELSHTHSDELTYEELAQSEEDDELLTEEKDEPAELTVEAVQLPADEALKVGDRVNWSNCPAHCENLAPFEIMEVHGDYAKLDLFSKRVPLAELEKCDRTASR
jgi:hypothetical protein